MNVMNISYKASEFLLTFMKTIHQSKVSDDQ